MNISRSMPMFSMSFRAFFPLAALAAVLYPTLFVSSVTGNFIFKDRFVSALTWHGHEMIFGFALALLVGFLFTAGSHWTNKAPLSGKHLMFMAALWMIERLAFFFPFESRGVLVALVSPFLVVTFAYMVRMLRSNRKNLIVFSLLFTCLLISKVCFLAHVISGDVYLANLGKHIGLSVFKIMIVVIAGRIVPFFAKKRFPEVSISVPAWVDRLAVGSVVATVFLPFVLHSGVVTALLVLAAVAQFTRLSFWTHRKLFSEPMLWILWLGYASLGLHFFLDALVYFFPAWNFSQSALHAFGAGSLGLFAIGMMSRVSLGHTQRPICADRYLLVAFLCVALGAALRVSIPILDPGIFFSSLHYATGFWTLGFAILLVKFIPIWVKSV